MFKCDRCYDRGIRGNSKYSFCRCRCGADATCVYCNYYPGEFFRVVSVPGKGKIGGDAVCQQCKKAVAEIEEEERKDGYEFTYYELLPDFCDIGRD